MGDWLAEFSFHPHLIFKSWHLCTYPKALLKQNTSERLLPKNLISKLFQLDFLSANVNFYKKSSDFLILQNQII